MRLQWFGIGFGAGALFVALILAGLCYSYDEGSPKSPPWYDPVDHR